jgi:hypothetical protein
VRINYHAEVLRGLGDGNIHRIPDLLLISKKEKGGNFFLDS